MVLSVLGGSVLLVLSCLTRARVDEVCALFGRIPFPAGFAIGFLLYSLGCVALGRRLERGRWF